MHNDRIGSLYMQKRNHNGHCAILKIRINKVSKIIGFAFCIFEVAIGCSHPLMMYWTPLDAKTKATCSLPHPENERQQSINNFWSCIVCNLSVACAINSYMKEWRIFQAKPWWSSMLPHHENVHQWNAHNFWSCILANQGSVQILEHRTELLTACFGENAKYKWKNTDSKILNNANFKTCNKRLLDVE